MDFGNRLRNRVTRFDEDYLDGAEMDMFSQTEYFHEWENFPENSDFDPPTPLNWVEPPPSDSPKIVPNSPPPPGSPKINPDPPKNVSNPNKRKPSGMNWKEAEEKQKKVAKNPEHKATERSYNTHRRKYARYHNNNKTQLVSKIMFFF